MSRVIYRLLLGALLVATLSGGVFAQERTYSIMIIVFRGMTEAELGFTDYLKDRLPVSFLLRDANGDRTLIKPFLEEAKEKKVDLIYTFGTSVTLETVGRSDQINLQTNIVDIPVVFNIVADPVGAGLANALSATHRNLTGVSHLVPMIDQLTTMKRFKNVSKLGVIYNTKEANSVLAVQQLRQYSHQFKFDLIEGPLASGTNPLDSEVNEVMEALLMSHPDFIYLPSDSSIIARSGAIVSAATAAGIPTISATEGPIRDSGALMGLVSNYNTAGQFAAYKAEQVLTGKEKIDTIPIETLQRFTIVINMKTALKLNLFPPLSIIKIAQLL
jgi:putative ABC transport system substrate-binding protein